MVAACLGDIYSYCLGVPPIVAFYIFLKLSFGLKKLSEEVLYRDFKKLDIRVGTIKSCEKVEGSDKLYRLMVDCGEAEVRQILSSLVDFYRVKELVGKVIPVIVNLKPAKIFDEMSYGMLLAAELGEKCVLLTTDKPIENGARIT